MKLRLNKALRAAVLSCGAAALSCGVAQADFVWNLEQTGNSRVITTESWNNHDNWTVPEGTTLADNKGPGVPNSDAWDPITINNGADGSVEELEGWTLNLTVQNGSELTIDNLKKMQGGTHFTVGDASSLTIDLGQTATGNDGGTVAINLTGSGALTLNLYKDKGGDVTTVNYGQISGEGTRGVFTLTGKETTRTYNSLILAADIGSTTSATTTLHTFTLAETSNVNITTLSYNIGGEFVNSGSTEALQATDDNIGLYSIVNENGTYKLYYVTGREEDAGKTLSLTEGAAATSLASLDGYGNTLGKLNVNVTPTGNVPDDAAVLSVDKDFTLGTLNANGGALQVDVGAGHTLELAQITGGEGASIAFSGTGTLRKTGSGELTISDLSGFTGTLAMADDTSVTVNSGATLAGLTMGNNTSLTVNSGATLAGLTMGNNTSLTVSGEGHTVTIGTQAADLGTMGSGVTISTIGQTHTLNAGTGATLRDNRYLLLNGGTLNVGGGGTVEVFGISLSCSGNNATTVDIAAGTTMHIFGTSHDTTAGNKAAFSLAHWNAANRLNVNGTLISDAAIVSIAGPDASLNVKSGGKLVMTQGLLGYERDSGAMSVINIESGGTLSVGSAETNTSAALTVNMAAGSTIEAYDGEGGNNTNGNSIVGQTLTLGTGEGVVNFSAASGKTLTLKSLTGDRGINIKGAGTVALDGVTFAGTTSVEEGSTLSLKGNVTISKAIDSAGTVSLAEGGTLTIADVDGLEASGEMTYSDAVSHSTQNGYVNASYIVVKGSGTVTGLNSVTLDGHEHNLTTESSGNRVITLNGTGGDYYVREGTVVYGGTGENANNAASAATTGIVLNGGKLEMQQNLADRVNITLAADGTVSLASDVTLSGDRIARNEHSLTLGGTGKFIHQQEDGDFSLSKYGFADDWNGTVELEAKTSRIDLSANTSASYKGTMILNFGNHIKVGVNSSTNSIFGENTHLVLNAGTADHAMILDNQYTGKDHALTLASLSSGADGTAVSYIRGDWGGDNVDSGDNRYLKVVRNDSTTFAGIFHHQGHRDVGLIKEGTGNLTLTGANASGADLDVNGGTVTLKDSGTWAGAINVGAAGTLAFNGANKEIAADKSITFADGATLAVTGGSLTINKGLSVTKLNLSGGGTMTVAENVTTGALRASSDNDTSISTVTIQGDSTLHVTGEAMSVEGNNASFMLAEAGGTVNLDVHGSFISDAGFSVRDGKGKINIKDGGTVRLNKGLAFVHNGDWSHGYINIESGGTLELCNTASNEPDAKLHINFADGATLAAGEESGTTTVNFADADVTYGTDEVPATINLSAGTGQNLTIASAISGLNGINLQGVGTKTFSAAVTAGNITISGGTADFDGAVTTGALTVGAATTMSALNLSGETTVNANLTVEGGTTLSGENASIVIGDNATFTTGNETINKLKSGTDNTTTISGTGTVSVATAGITYTNALIDVTAASNISTIAATLHDSKVVNKNTDESSPGVNVSADSLADGTNDVAAEDGNITITGVGEDGVTVQNLTVQSGQDVSATAAGGSSAPATIVVSGTADVSGSVSANVTVQSDPDDADAAPATFTANAGAEVNGNLTVTGTGKLDIAIANDDALTVNGVMTLEANSKLDFTTLVSALDIKQQTEDQTFVIANAASFNIIDSAATTVLGLDGLSWTLSNISGVILSSSNSVGTNPATPAMFAMRNATDSLTLTVLGQSSDPVTLTATATASYSYAEGMLTIGVAENLNGVTGDFNVTVGDDAWQAIVNAMSGVEGGVNNDALITLTGADGVQLPLAGYEGTVSFNGYAGTGTKGQYHIASIPEPTTATLSLLALAALAARRRRK